jgi:tripartite-type tricarboxylate transporter receptor subunit TctC
MPKTTSRILAVTVAVTASVFAIQSATAQGFYNGKTITIISPYPPGGTYDRMARLAARHMPKHIPGNPSMIVQNRPGGGGLIGVRAAYKAKPDGLTMTHFASTVVLRKLLGSAKDIDFKKMGWLGSVGGAHYIMLVRSERKERSLADFQRAKNAIKIGSTGPASLLTISPKLLMRAGGFNLKLVSGYKGFNPLALALKQKEIEAVATAALTLKVVKLTESMFKDGTVRIAVSMGGAPPPAWVAKQIAAAPKLRDAIKDPTDRKVYDAFASMLSATRPFVTGPGLPAARLATLKKAFQGMTSDPAFTAAATKQGFVLSILDGDQAKDKILSSLSLPKATEERMIKIFK